METSINPTQRNPRCPWAARLADVIQNDEAIRIDLRTGDVMYIPFFRGWREKSETLVVASVYDRDIDLVEAGAHPSIVDGEWDRDHILVLVDRDTIKGFVPWAQEAGYALAAKRVKETFPEFFWSDVALYSL